MIAALTNEFVLVASRARNQPFDHSGGVISPVDRIAGEDDFRAGASFDGVSLDLLQDVFERIRAASNIADGVGNCPHGGRNTDGKARAQASLGADAYNICDKPSYRRRGENQGCAIKRRCVVELLAG
jgi:hypothetical protein